MNDKITFLEIEKKCEISRCTIIRRCKNKNIQTYSQQNINGSGRPQKAISTKDLPIIIMKDFVFTLNVEPEKQVKKIVAGNPNTASRNPKGYENRFNGYYQRISEYWTLNAFQGA